MKIEIKKAKFINFKKFRNYEINFTKETNIRGSNRSGKTSVVDAFMWLLFGRDSHGNTKFDIKNTDKEGETIPKIEVSVFFDLLVDGIKTPIGRTLKEIWAPIMGSSETYLKSHTTVYTWQNVDIPEGEFIKKRDELVSKDLFKLLTSVNYFTSLEPTPQRDLLMGLVKDVQDSDLINLMENKSSYKKSSYLIEILDNKIDLDLAKKSLQGKIKVLKESIKEIPVRIDQSDKSKPESQNFEKLNIELKKLGAELLNVLLKINDRSKVLTDFNNSRLGEQKEVSSKKSELASLESKISLKIEEDGFKLDADLSKNKKELSKLKKTAYDIGSESKDNSDSVIGIEKERTELLSEYKKVNTSTFEFNNTDGNCSNCGKILDDVEEIKTKAIRTFEDNRIKGLKEIVTKGEPLTAKVKKLEDRNEQIACVLPEIENDIEALKIQVAGIENDIEANDLLKPLDCDEYKKAKEEFEAIETAFNLVTKPIINNAELLAEKEDIRLKIDSIKELIATKSQIENINLQIEGLKKREKDLVSELLKLESDLNSLESFQHLKIKHLESEVNKLFKFVKFQMFETLMNGNIKDICKATHEGIKFNSLNTEAQINAGLDIINVFSKLNDSYCPIFIDNRESVTDIIDIDTQIINLIVDANYTELKIN